MKKILSVLSLIAISLSIFRLDLLYALIGPDFNVKISSNNDSTYTTNLENVGSGTSLTFKNVVILDSTTNETYSINFPAGFSYSSYDLSENTCVFNLISRTNSNFKYSLSDSGAVCESVIKFNYTINGNANTGINTINLLNSLNQIDSQISINIQNSNYITRAQTLDIDYDGYIDAYMLSLANSNNISSLSGLNVAGVNVGTIYMSGTSYILPFTDAVYNTGDLPQISGTFDGNTISNNTIIEEDFAKPKIMRINSSLLSSLGSSYLNIGTGGILFEISENLTPSSLSAFSFLYGTSSVSGNFSFQNDDLTKLYFSPSSGLSAGTYALNATSLAKDWSSNGNILSVSTPTLIVSDIENPNGLAIGTSTGISINNGASLTNNNLVQLQLLASDNVGVSQMMISNYSDFSGATWETYNTDKYNWNLGTTTGIKTIYVKFKDTSGNISATYSTSIEYGETNNYINFNILESIYTDTTNINLSGSCNYISNTGAVLGNTLSGSVNGVSIGTISCNSQTWSYNFNITPNSTNTIRLEFDNNSSIYNEIQIINPVPSCITPTNGTLVTGTIYPTCDFTCNIGYTKQGGTCVAKSSPVNQAIHNSRTFSFTAFTLYYNSPQTKSSLPLNITNGTSTLTTTFTLASDGTTINLSNSSETISCNSGYHASGTSCVINTTTGGGGGGGAGSITPTCIDSMLQCSLYNGAYIWIRKTGVSCNGGNLGLACTPTTSTGTTSTGTTSTGSTIDTSTGAIDNGQNDSADTGSSGGTSTGITQIPEIIEIIKTDGTKIYFKDISNHFAKNYIINLAASGIVNGYSDNTFRPDNNTTRIEFLKILLKGLGKDYSSLAGQKNPFFDVPDDSWQSPVVAKALSLGIISQNKYFYPNKAISREEATKMLIKLSGLSIVNTNKSSFADGNTWAINYIETAYKNNIISGQNISGKLMFRPTDFITRAEVTKLIVRTIGLVGIKIEQTNQSTSMQKFVKDYYSLTKELKFGDYNDEVGYLQDIMKHFNYFDYDSTKYYGNITKASYINFAKEKLGLISTGDIVKSSEISKILNLEW